MKRYLALILALVLSCSVLAGCGSKNETPADTTPASTDTTPASTDTDWPKDNVTMVVPYSAGGDTDTYCRQMCKILTEKLGVNFVVVNTTGGAGVVASSSVLGAITPAS